MAELKDIIAGLKPKTKRTRGYRRLPPSRIYYDPYPYECNSCGCEMSGPDMVTHMYLQLAECRMCAAETVFWRCFEEDEMIVKGSDPKPDMTKSEMAVMSVNANRATITLRCSWNPFFTEALKSSLRPSERRWNSDDRVWEIHPSRAKDAEQILKQFYAGVQILGTKPAGGSKFERLLCLLKKEDKQSIYKLLALKYHPDRGGSHEIMTIINDIFKQP
jgi:hypothetical protein